MFESSTSKRGQTVTHPWKGRGLVDCDGNPERVSFALGTCHPPCHPLAALGLAKPSRDAPLPAVPAGSARVSSPPLRPSEVRLMSKAG
jgi:hypothetical protein